MRIVKRILLSALLLIVLLLVVIGIFVGPWPTYAASEFESADYYQQAVKDIDAAAADNDFNAAPGRLQAGWARREITPKTGTPMGGYGARFKITPSNLLFNKYDGDQNSTGVHDPLFVKALAISDAKDTAIIAGADMLIIPPNIAAMVRERVAAETPLTERDILFGASHTHCGPGAFAPGLAARITGGKHDPELVEMLAQRFADAIIEAYKSMQPARLAHDSVDAPQFIRNRARDNGGVDSELSYLSIERDDGKRCFLVSFSAHPTNYGDDMLEFTAEYPGALMRTIEQQTGAEAIYLGGALGSMGPRSPDAPTQDERVAAMGAGLAQLILADAAQLTPENFVDTADVASVGLPLGMPKLQMRPVSTKWRLSPLVAKILGNPVEGWMQGVRVGDLFFVGLPFDFSGEISADWKQWAEKKGLDLWTSSFCAAYCGYLSPDKYYMVEPLGYETGFMSWCGPNAEAYFTALFRHAVGALTPNVKEAA